MSPRIPPLIAVLLISSVTDARVPSERAIASRRISAVWAHTFSRVRTALATVRRSELREELPAPGRELRVRNAVRGDVHSVRGVSGEGEQGVDGLEAVGCDERHVGSQTCAELAHERAGARRDDADDGDGLGTASRRRGGELGESGAVGVELRRADDLDAVLPRVPAHAGGEDCPVLLVGRERQEEPFHAELSCELHMREPLVAVRSGEPEVASPVGYRDSSLVNSSSVFDGLIIASVPSGAAFVMGIWMYEQGETKEPKTPTTLRLRA